MHVPLAAVLGTCYAASEAILTATRRAGPRTARADRGSLALLWLVIGVSVGLAIEASYRLRSFGFAPSAFWEWLGTVVFVSGVVLRWYAIGHLGRFFTVNVAIAEDHRLIDTGPYRLMRHPSYTGSLIAILGIAISMCNLVSFLVLLGPTILVFLHRMGVEEQALLAAFGERYRSYMRSTARLLPGIY
ncbi:MAG TPA: isoprenylcysteine carboxylmethyltransferase family protein [Steroidobacteraceae bacterium]|nr:isoprenylcysteine carboxylmethyltransferase family protein [Steroidobacteraceae bacterium]